MVARFSFNGGSKRLNQETTRELTFYLYIVSNDRVPETENDQMTMTK